jgi:peroxiredoxin
MGRDCDAMPNPKKGLPAGTPAPDFALPAAGGSTVRLGDYRGGWVVLYFDRGTF